MKKIQEWHNADDNDTIYLDGKYGWGYKFDFERASQTEAEKQLKAWGYEFQGWTN
jgi:hypothetical protein